VSKKFIRAGLVAALTIASTISGPFSLSGPASASESADLLNGTWQIYAQGQDVSISWDLNAETTTTLSVNGQTAITEDGIGHLYLPNQVPGAHIDVSLQATQALSNEQVLELADQHDITQEVAAESYENVYASGIPFTIPRDVGQVELANAYSLLPDVSIFRYQTFIPYESVDGPGLPFPCNAGKPGIVTFNGNNRGFNATSNSFKTRLDTWIDWNSGGNVTSNAFVGETVMTWYLLFASFEERRTASSSSMLTTLISKSTDVVKFQISQDVANPFCLPLVSLGISFDLTVKIWRSGRYTLGGTAIRVPSHEAYIKDSNSPLWSPVLRRGFDGLDAFNCFSVFNANAPECTSTYLLDNVR
jgi:hypothetical protein